LPAAKIRRYGLLMKIILNGEPRDLTQATSIAALLTELGIAPKGVAVERNLLIVPKSRYDETVLEDGDVLEIIQFVGGG
jgi:thiamine biosynthesis protein ThiS